MGSVPIGLSWTAAGCGQRWARSLRLLEELEIEFLGKISSFYINTEKLICAL